MICAGQCSALPIGVGKALIPHFILPLLQLRKDPKIVCLSSLPFSSHRNLGEFFTPMSGAGKWVSPVSSRRGCATRKVRNPNIQTTSLRKIGVFLFGKVWTRMQVCTDTLEIRALRRQTFGVPAHHALNLQQTQQLKQGPLV